MTLPLITIGMTSYNAADTIGRALDSALKQDWGNYEIVVVDDASKDESPDIIRKKINGHANARLIVHAENKGFAGALNTMLAEAKGEFVAIFDDDDESRSDRLSCQYRTITEYESKTGASMIGCWGSGMRFYPNGHVFHFQAIGSRPQAPVGTAVIDHLLFFGRAPGLFFGGGTPSCSLMARAATFKAAGPYDLAMKRSEDTDFSVRLALKGGHFIGCPEEVILQHSTDSHDKRPEVTYESYCRLMEKYKDYLQSKKRYHYALGWQKIKFYHFSGRPVRALLATIQLAARHPRWTWYQFWASAPKRLMHEQRIKQQATPAPSLSLNEKP